MLPYGRIKVLAGLDRYVTALGRSVEKPRVFTPRFTLLWVFSSSDDPVGRCRRRPNDNRIRNRHVHLVQADYAPAPIPKATLPGLFSTQELEGPLIDRAPPHCKPYTRTGFSKLEVSQVVDLPTSGSRRFDKH